MPSAYQVQDLYHQLITAWNQRDANAYAALFEPDATLIGFDGSQMTGQAQALSELTQIFHDHQTAPYISKIQAVRFLTPDVAILSAIAGMPKSGTQEINPAVNAIQSLVAQRHDNTWRIALFQNTPAQFHGRPELVAQMTEELRSLL